MDRLRPDDDDIIGSRPDEQSDERTSGSRQRRHDERGDERNDERRRDRDEFDPTSRGDESGEVT